MILLAAGLAAAVALFWAAGTFSRASVAGVKGLLAWLAALAGLSLAAMLFLTGRGAAAIGGLVFMAPMAWTWWQESKATPRTPKTTMARHEALDILGLTEGASDSDIKAAWVRLMRIAHPDSGGSDWLASRVNQAKDILLKRR